MHLHLHYICTCANLHAVLWVTKKIWMTSIFYKCIMKSECKILKNDTYNRVTMDRKYGNYKNNKMTLNINYGYNTSRGSKIKQKLYI